MKKLLNFALLSMALVFITFSCGKYEEGSKFTFLTAKSRMVNDWKLTDVTTNGISVFSAFPATTMSIKKDDTYSIIYTSGGISVTENGTWAFNSDKTRITLTASDNSTANYIIVMLKSKMIKLQDADLTSSNVDILTFEQK